MGNELVNRQAVKLNGKTIGFVFDDVPDIQKKPPGPGPFERVPSEQFSTPEIGSLKGKWWRVTPFNSAPWAVLSPPPPEVLPVGFEKIFGSRPHSSNFHGELQSKDFRVATVTWENNLKTYVGPNIPDDADPVKMGLAAVESVKYEMGEPAYYENNNGYKVRFPDSQEPNFEAPFDGFVNTGTGQIIVLYQNRLTNDGIIIPVDKMHPMGAQGELGKRQLKLRRDKVKADKAAKETEKEQPLPTVASDPGPGGTRSP